MIFLICPAFLYALMEPCHISGALEFCGRMQKKRILLKIQLFYTGLRRNSVFFPYFSHPVTVIYPKQWAAD